MSSSESLFGRLRGFWRELAGGLDRVVASKPALSYERLEARLALTHAPADHVHAQLSIILDGQPVTIPSDIGLSVSGHFNPHTHDTTGTLHIGEGGPAGLGNELRLITLDDFFDVWRERGGFAGNNPASRFDSTHILDRTADSSHVVRMLVNGQLNTQYEQYTPHDGDQIVIRYDALPPAPTGLVLASVSDSGASSSDRITRETNWQIQVSGIFPGSQVELRSGATVLGQATSSGSTVNIAVDVSSLSDGVTNIIAFQSAGGLTSPASSSLAVTLDRAGPQFTLTPRAAIAGQNYSFDVSAPEEGQNGFAFQLIAAPAGVTIAPATGGISWLPTVVDVGRHAISVRATDVAGNPTNVSGNLFAVGATTPWRNPVNQLDVNGDAIISALDVLVMVNRINSGAARELPAPTSADSPLPFHDVTGDNLLSPLDVLQVVNFLNSQAGGEREKMPIDINDDWDILLDQLAVDRFRRYAV